MSSEKFWPTPGQKLIHKPKKGAGQIEGEVLEVDQYTGRVSLRVQGHVYPSLSAAATAISGSSTNGWVYWGLKKPKQKST